MFDDNESIMEMSAEHLEHLSESMNPVPDLINALSEINESKKSYFEKNNAVHVYQDNVEMLKQLLFNLYGSNIDLPLCCKENGCFGKPSEACGCSCGA